MNQMKYVCKYNEQLPTKVTDWYDRRTISTSKLMLVTAEFHDGPCEKPDPFHQHPHEQVSYMADGEVYLLVDNEPAVHLTAGDTFAIPSNVPHTIQRLTPYVRIIDCFTPIREDFLK
jgi:mannose-6-phosphate isomerase-like protein (cupin superfamily)